MTTLDQDVAAFLEKHHSAAMTTLRRDGSPHTVRVAIALVDGNIWSSGTQDRIRTAHLRRDPRATLMAFDDAWAYLALDCRVTLIEDSTVPAQSVRLFETMQRHLPGYTPGMLTWYGKPVPVAEFKQRMVDERRLIYQFEPLRHYGIYGAPPS